MAFYRRNLPHWQPAGATYFITFSLAGSLPKKALQKLKEERIHLQKKLNQHKESQKDRYRFLIQKKIFQKYEKLIDERITGPLWLKNLKVADIVKESIHYRDQKEYDLYAYCIMPNHVHLVFKHLSESKLRNESRYPVTEILASLKKYTSRICNEILNRSGNAFWHPESYDHVIRDSDELNRIIYYTLQNPVKASLVNHWKEWPHSFCCNEFKSLF